MNELTIHGNLTDDPTIHYSREGHPVLRLCVAVNRRRYDRAAPRWIDAEPIYHRVVAFRALAENAANLPKGALVSVTGELADDSWTAQDGTRERRTQLLADDIAASLRFATVTITKNPRVSDTDNADDAGGGSGDQADGRGGGDLQAGTEQARPPIRELTTPTPH